jgi:hypothetical protein
MDTGAKVGGIRLSRGRHELEEFGLQQRKEIDMVISQFCEGWCEAGVHYIWQLN